MISQACQFISAAKPGSFFVVCGDRALLYSCEADSANDDGSKAEEWFRFAPYLMTADEFAECCLDIGVDYMVV